MPPCPRRAAPERAGPFLPILALIAACGSGERAAIMQTTPASGEASRAELGGGIRLVFDRDVAPPESVGREVVTPAALRALTGSCSRARLELRSLLDHLLVGMKNWTSAT